MLTMKVIRKSVQVSVKQRRQHDQYSSLQESIMTDFYLIYFLITGPWLHGMSSALLQYHRCSPYDKVGSRTELMSSYCAVNGINTAAGQYIYKVSQKNLTKIGPWVHAMSSALLQYHRCSPYDKVGSRTELMSSCCALNRINSAAGWYTNTRCPRKT